MIPEKCEACLGIIGDVINNEPNREKVAEIIFQRQFAYAKENRCDITCPHLLDSFDWQAIYRLPKVRK